MGRLRDCLITACKRLKPYIEELNDMNVFPIADKDTGRNLYKTLSFLFEKDEKNVSQEIFLHARGNSGNILGLFFRSWPEEITEDTNLKAYLDEAIQLIYSYVLNIQEGTIVSAMKCYPREFSNLEGFFTGWLKNIEKSILEAPSILPILEEYQTLDSGAVGFYYLIGGIAEELGIKYPIKHFYVKRLTIIRETSNLFCTEALVASRAEERSYLPALESLGESLITFKDNNFIKIHIHTKDPQKIKNLCESLGQIKDWKVDEL